MVDKKRGISDEGRVVAPADDPNGVRAGDSGPIDGGPGWVDVSSTASNGHEDVPSGGQWTPPNEQHRVRLENHARRNEAHRGTWEPLPLSDFLGCEFPASIKTNSVRFNNGGDVEVTLVVPRSYRHAIVDLGGAIGFPLVVGLTKWQNPNT